jgi:hypothetical protein
VQEKREETPMAVANPTSKSRADIDAQNSSQPVTLTHPDPEGDVRVLQQVEVPENNVLEQARRHEADAAVEYVVPEPGPGEREESEFLRAEVIRLNQRVEELTANRGIEVDEELPPPYYTG